jgi:uncharacterized protein YdaU (DUF1376 family)
MSAPPYMRFNFAHYTVDTDHLTTAQEHGAYFLLLKAMWIAGGKLPADDKRLARIAKVTEAEWRELRDTILPFFKRRGGIIRHKRVDAEFEHYKSRSESASQAGKVSASKRANKNNVKAATNVERPTNQKEKEPDSRTEPLQGSSSTSDASEPARPEGAVSSRPRLTVVPKAEPKPVRPATAAERRAEIAAILAKPKPEAPPPAPAETQAQMVERLRKSIVPGGAA